MVPFAVAFALAGLMIWGLLTSRKKRNIDRRHLAAFGGFNAGVVAVGGIIYDLAVTTIRGHASPLTMSPVLQVFDAVVSLIFFTALLVSFLAGLFSRGRQRIALVCCSVLISMMLVLTIAAHFGD
jgi:hypothetical protein